MNEQIVIGRCDEAAILPCSFESELNIVIHWKNQDNHSVHSYYKNGDQVEKHPKYAKGTSLFHSEIHNGNASLRRLSLLDEGIYVCYVGTETGHITNKVLLEMGAIFAPVMQYEKRNTNSFLVCSVLIVYPLSHIMWRMDNAIGNKLGLRSFITSFNITGSNSSYCAIENLLMQRWTGWTSNHGTIHGTSYKSAYRARMTEWNQRDGFWKMQNDHISLLCQVISDFSLLNQDFRVPWSRVESGTSSLLACSQNTIINDLDSHKVTSLTDLTPSDSTEYLCTISSSEYTLLTIHMLPVGALFASFFVRNNSNKVKYMASVLDALQALAAE
ncbi:LOW QUALITY PROTEIN: HERV-H LTR-associating protein 2 [Urocitellus parryii]